MSHYHRTLYPQCPDEPVEVGCHGREVVAGVRLERLTVSPLVNRHDAELFAQYRRDQVPDAAVGRQPVNQYD